MLIHGDCLDVLPTLPSASIDMVFADLPYGVTQNKWDTQIPLEPLWQELLRVGKPRCSYVFTATQPFATTLICSQRKLFRYDLVWDRLAKPSGFLQAKLMPMRRHEMLYIFYRKLPTYNPQMRPGEPYRVTPNRLSTNSTNYGLRKPWGGKTNESGERYPVSVLGIKRDRAQKLHPTQKPVPLIEWLIRTYSNPGDTVLDPTCGSATTAVAAINQGRRWVCIEREWQYIATARRRIREALATARQLPLAGVS